MQGQYWWPKLAADQEVLKTCQEWDALRSAKSLGAPGLAYSGNVLPVEFGYGGTVPSVAIREPVLVVDGGTLQ